MMKLTKKFIAIMLTVVFVLSMLPMGVLAEAKQVKLLMTNWSTTRSNDTYQTLSSSNSIQIRNNGGGNIYYGHSQLDLTGYEEILGNSLTRMTVSLRGGTGSSTYSVNDFDIAVLPDSTDGYDAKTMIHSEAEALGLHSTTDRVVLYTYTSDASATGITIGSEISVRDVLDMLNTGYDNSIVTFVYSSVNNERSYIDTDHNDTFIAINYDDSEINNQEYVNSAAEKLTWDILSSEDKNMVTSNLNLPKKFYGAYVVWESSNPDVINPSSGEVVVQSDAAISVTLTARLSYSGISDTTYTASQPFNVVVRDPASIVEDERIELSNYAYSRSSDSNKENEKDYPYGYYTYDGIGDVIRTGSSFTAYGQFDLSGYEEILANPNTTVSTRFEAGGENSGKIYDIKAILAADKADVYKQDTVTYNIAEEIGLHDDDRPLLFIKSDGTSYNRGSVVPFESNKDTLIEALNEGTDNSVVSLHFVGITYGENSNLRVSSEKSGLFISYDKSEINNTEYLKEVKDALTWDVISKGKQDKVSADLYLPTKFKGAKIVWESNDAAISSDGKVDFANNKGKTVKLTAKMTYTNILGQSVEAEKEFEVTISDGEYYEIGTPDLIIEDNKFKASWSVENYTGEDVTYYVYLAAYSDKELVGLTPVEYVAKNGEPTFINPEVKFQEGYTAKLIVLKSDHITPLFAATEK